MNRIFNQKFLYATCPDGVSRQIEILEHPRYENFAQAKINGKIFFGFVKMIENSAPFARAAKLVFEFIYNPKIARNPTI